MGFDGKVNTSISLTAEQLNILDLLALQYQVSRSRCVVTKLIEPAREGLDDAEEAIAARLWNQWGDCDEDRSFDDFLKLARNWLVTKHIAPEYILSIVTRLSTRKKNATND